MENHIKYNYYCDIKQIMCNMEGKTVIITGANCGIGKETARSLAKIGARVIMACRNLETANEARDDIMKYYPWVKIIIHKLDLCSFESVRKFAELINNTETHIDVLIHNAGIGGGFYKFYETKDNLDVIMQTNYLAPFLLTHLLIDLIKRSAPSRIIVVSSILHKTWICNEKTLKTRAFMPFFQYCKTKTAEVRFTVELARRIEGTGVTAICLTPGTTDTPIYRYVKFPFSILMNCARMAMRSVEEGAKTSVYCAVAPEVEKVSGKYFSDCKEIELWKTFRNEKKNKKLWEATYKIVQLRDSDPKI